MTFSIDAWHLEKQDPNGLWFDRIARLKLLYGKDVVLIRGFKRLKRGESDGSYQHTSNEERGEAYNSSNGRIRF